MVSYAPWWRLKCRRALKALFPCFNLCISVMLESIVCPIKFILFLITWYIYLFNCILHPSGSRNTVIQTIITQYNIVDAVMLLVVCLRARKSHWTKCVIINNKIKSKKNPTFSELFQIMIGNLGKRRNTVTPNTYIHNLSLYSLGTGISIQEIW